MQPVKMDGNNARERMRAICTIVGDTLAAQDCTRRMSIESRGKLFDDYCKQQSGKDGLHSSKTITSAEQSADVPE